MYSDVQYQQLPKGVLFNVLVFLAFFASTPALTPLPVGGAILNLREVCLILLPLVYSFYPNRDIQVISKPVKYLVVAFVLMTLLSEMLKIPVYASGLSSYFRAFRVCVALFSAMLILIQGVKIDPEGIKKAILLSLLVSFILTVVLDVMGMGPKTIAAGDEQIELNSDNGRFGNQNASMAIFAIAFLLDRKLLMETFGRQKLLAYITFSFAVIILVFSFNRTMLAAAAIMVAYYFLRGFSVKKIFQIAILAAICVKVLMYLYDTNKKVKDQFDYRIFTVWEHGFDQENREAIAGQRTMLYKFYEERFGEYYPLGIPIEVGFAPNSKTGKPMNTSDISVLTITLRYGIIVGIVFLILIWQLFRTMQKKYPGHKKANKVYNKLVVPYIMGFLCSLNIDLFARHNFIVFLVLFLFAFVFDNGVIYNHGSLHYDPLPAGTLPEEPGNNRAGGNIKPGGLADSDFNSAYT